MTSLTVQAAVFSTYRQKLSYSAIDFALEMKNAADSELN
jgi:hypothetical protein